jgi:hypothetical protein
MVERKTNERSFPPSTIINCSERDEAGSLESQSWRVAIGIGNGNGNARMF